MCKGVCNKGIRACVHVCDKGTCFVLYCDYASGVLSRFSLITLFSLSLSPLSLFTVAKSLGKRVFKRQHLELLLD